MNYIAFLFTAASIVGTLANSFQKKWCFYIWLCTNSFWCIYNTINAQYAQALLYVFNLATCIIGLYKWRRPVQIAADLSNGHDKGCIVEYRKTKSGIDVLSCKYDDGAATDTENNATLRGDNLKELVLPPLRRCKHCGKTGVYYGENFGGGASMRAEAIIKHHNADGEEIFLCQNCHLKAHEIKPHAADGFRADVVTIDEPTKPENVPEETIDPSEKMSKGLSMFADGFSIWLSSACAMAVKALTDFAKAANGDNVRFAVYKATAANKRVLHNAYNAKRYRTRKKNLARLHREYKKYIKKGGGRK